MNSTDKLVQLIAQRFEKRLIAQVEGYKSFKYVKTTDTAVIVLREVGTEWRVPFAKIAIALQAVQGKHSVYSAGPGALRQYGITHVQSPIWALMHLLSLEEIVS